MRGTIGDDGIKTFKLTPAIPPVIVPDDTGVQFDAIKEAFDAPLTLIEGLAKEGDIGLHAAPMFHLADGSFSLMLTLRGCTHVMVPGFLPERVLDTIQKPYDFDDLLTKIRSAIGPEEDDDHPKLF